MATKNYSLIFSIIFLPLIRSATQLAPALYVFGDSLFDSGNNNLLPTIARANYRPYGANFEHKSSTGRFTNGKTVPDFIAEFLGLPYSPPYLRISNKLPLTGLNYASGSCGILPETGRTSGKCINFEEQVGLFEEARKSLQRQFKSSEEFSNYLSKSIFIISIGSNDYMSNYLETLFCNTNKRYAPQQFAQLLVDKVSHQLQFLLLALIFNTDKVLNIRLYNLGARKVVMFEIGPIGCIPSITRKNKHTGKCVEDKNQLVSYFNNLLPAMLQNLTSSFKGSSFVNGHAYWLGYDAIINPSNYGLMDSSNPCCTAWFNGTSGCIPFLKPCSNADKHYFWDAYHLTEAMYSAIASRCINDKSVCMPFNLQELLKL